MSVCAYTMVHVYVLENNSQGLGLSFHTGFWGLNSGSEACVARAMTCWDILLAFSILINVKCQVPYCWVADKGTQAQTYIGEVTLSTRVLLELTTALEKKEV